MAAEMEVKLGEVVFSQRKVRFLHLKSSEEVLFGEELTENYMPLFLGADVLARCSVSVANLPRTHAKFAKHGLASKITFPATVRIRGLHGTGRGLWFYSIQGLFRVAFEYYNREDQFEVLNLQNVWKQRISDDLLTQNINLADFRPEEQSSLNCANSQTVAEVKTTTESLKETEGAEPQQGCDPMDPSDISSNGSNGQISDLNCLLNSYLSDSNGNEKRGKLVSDVAYWLGREFRDARLDIEARAERFKKSHIAAIDCLPPAEQVIKELFPQSMSLFLCTWMGRDEDTSQSTVFPLMQLILEFANQTLVSGVSHVLYSRLIKTDRV